MRYPLTQKKNRRELVHNCDLSSNSKEKLT